MAQFCDVALPVPLEMNFTYALEGAEPVVGGRVLVPFRNERLPGVVVALHDRPPKVEAKKVLAVLDTEPVLDASLLRLGEWIAHYYLAPLGEVLRTMLPLGAEVRRAHSYRITDLGLETLHASATQGTSRRSKRSHDEQVAEMLVLDYLADREAAREERLRAATRVSGALLAGLVRKKWVTREDVSAARDARRTVRIAVLREIAGKLNPNQRRLAETLAAAGGRLPLETLRGLDVPRTTLQTLVRRGLVEMVEEAAGFELSSFKPARAALDFPLNPAQQKALDHIQEAVDTRKFAVSLLYGVTGSGKTAVYLTAMQAVLRAGRGALLLVPEIGLTPAAAAHLAELFGDEVAILHSALTADERAEQWHRIRRGDARIVVGTRSAVFAPVRDLALIVVDEEQDTSYKQDETPRYHGRDVAVMRGKLAGAAVVLASATPALESCHNAKSGKYALLELPDRVEQRPLPQVEVIDMRAEFREAGREDFLSRQLVAELGECLARGEQAMVLLNRRGYSAVVLCRECGESLQCKNCAVALTFHQREQRMVCHFCGYWQKVPRVCPKCASDYIFFLGTGSEQLEERLRAQFPQARLARLDRDTVRGRRDFERVLGAFHAGELDLLAGTQMIAKGHDIHGVTLVGVVGADQALGFPDFRAAERTFQLFTQVAGRAGRGESPGKVILQTYFPEHYAVQFAARHDYAGFYEKEIRFRNLMRYPPFSALANVLVRSAKLEQALKWAGVLGRWFDRARHPGIRVLGPAAAPLVRLKRDYRYHFVLKSESRERLNALLRAMLEHAGEEKIPRTHILVDVDPQSLL
ncbi:MAG TPA: primosomal protein N' [Terriglobales bacterium]|jgi:primosomal protein N' (replication factor Y)|nr:primosomal protein N' [Terriglobales bacterium]